MYDHDHHGTCSGNILLDERHVTFLLHSSDPTPLIPPVTQEELEKLEQDLETPNIIYFDEDSEPSENRCDSCCCNSSSFLWRKCKHSKMWWCGCRRFCIILLFIKLVILGVVFPVVHLQETHQHEQNNYDNGYPNHGDGYPQHTDHNHHNRGEDDYAESVHVEPPTDQHDFGQATPTGQGNTEANDDIIVVRHEGDDSVGTALTTDAAKSASTTVDEPNKECHPQSQNPLENKLESIISAIYNIHQSIGKMETLMQGTLIDDQRSKCISAILSGNTSLALKHWTQILKYLSPSDAETSSALTVLIKEAYNGVPDRIIPLANFIQGTAHCSGFSTLYSEMINYGHVYGGHTYIFPVAFLLQKSCPLQFRELLPPPVVSMMEGSFTLQNKLSKGYLYYAKRCVARHYYHCVDVLTKRALPDEFSGLEEGSDEWRRYRWRLNSTGESNESGSTTAFFFFILNEDKYLPYRLQDMNNSPRFRMEEANSNFERNMGYFQVGLEDENQVVIRVRDTDMFLEGEEIQDNSSEVLLHSFHKTEKSPGTDRIKWVVSASESTEKARMGRSSAFHVDESLKFPLVLKSRY